MEWKICAIFIKGLEDIAHMSLYESVEPGNTCIEWQTMNDTGRVLIDTWFLGILGIAGEYTVGLRTKVVLVTEKLGMADVENTLAVDNGSYTDFVHDGVGVTEILPEKP